MSDPVPPIALGVRPADPPPDAEAGPGPLLVRRPSQDGRSSRVARVVTGAAVTVVEGARHLPQRLHNLKSQIGSGSRSGMAGDWTFRAQQRSRELRSRARAYSQQNPLMTVAIAGLSGLVLGFTVRLWRDHRG